MVHPVRQIRFRDWPKGLHHQIAFVDHPLTAIADGLKMDLESSEDNLDSFEGILIDADDFGPFALMEYRNPRYPGVLIKVLEESVTPSVLEDILRIVGVGFAEVTWIAPDARKPS